MKQQEATTQNQNQPHNEKGPPFPPADSSRIINPPCSNTGVGSASNTSEKEGFSFKDQILIDWLEFTLFINLIPENIPALLGIPDVLLEECPRGLNGYRKQLVAGSIRILFDGNEDMGTHVIIPGEALKDFKINPIRIIQILDHINSDRSAYAFKSYERTKKAVLREITIEPKGDQAERSKITRIDVAIDDFKGKLKLKKLKSAIRRGACVSRCRNWGSIEEGKIIDGSLQGETLYVGRRESNFMIRFYDKLKERIKAGFPPENLPEIWNRCEMEIKHESAIKLAKLLAGENGPEILGKYARGILNNYFSVRVKSNDQTRSRWKKADWWVEYVDTFEKVKIGRDILKKTLQQQRQWFDKQMGTVLAGLKIAFGSQELQRIEDSGMRRLHQGRYRKKRQEISKIRQERLQKEQKLNEKTEKRFSQDLDCRSIWDKRTGEFVAKVPTENAEKAERELLYDPEYIAD